AQPEVDTEDAAESAARIASPDRRIEREQARGGLVIVNVAVRAVQVRREAPSIVVRGCDIGVALLHHRVNIDPTLPDAECRFERLDHPRALNARQTAALLH